jgi:hypothetical protein
MSSDKLREIAAWIRQQSPGGALFEFTDDTCRHHRYTLAGEHEDMACRLESIAAPVPSAELGEITKDFRTWADRVTQKCQTGCADTEDCDNCDLWSGLEPLLTRVESLAAPTPSAELGKIADKLRHACKALYGDYTNGHLEKSEPVTNIEHHGKRLHALADELDSLAAPETKQPQPTTAKPYHGFVCARCDGVNMGRAYLVCDDCISQSADSIAAPETQPPHHPELLREICACLSAQGRPPSKEQLERWRDMLGGETVQPGECNSKSKEFSAGEDFMSEFIRERMARALGLEPPQPLMALEKEARRLRTIESHQPESVAEVVREIDAELREIAQEVSDETRRARRQGGGIDTETGNEWTNDIRAIASRLSRRLSRASVGPAEVWVKTRLSDGEVIGVRHIEPRDDWGGGRATSRSDTGENTKEQRFTVHGAQPKQECEDRIVGPDGEWTCGPKRELEEARKTYQGYVERAVARAETAEAQLAEIEEINAEYRTTIAQQQVDVAKAEARLRQSADDCDECEHAERYEAAHTAASLFSVAMEHQHLLKELVEEDRARILRKLEGQKKRTKEMEELYLAAARRHNAARYGWTYEPQPESTEQDNCPRCNKPRMPARHAQTSEVLGCICEVEQDDCGKEMRDECNVCRLLQACLVQGPLGLTGKHCPINDMQDDRGELPVCPDCGTIDCHKGRDNDPIWSGVVWYSCKCNSKRYSEEDWLRHVELRKALKTACRECGDLPNVQGGKGPRTAFCCCVCCENERGPCDGDCGNRLHTPAEWLKRNEVKDEGSEKVRERVRPTTGPAKQGDLSGVHGQDHKETEAVGETGSYGRQVGSALENEVKDDDETGHARGAGDCTGDDGAVGADVAHVAPALERAREKIQRAYRHLGKPTGVEAALYDVLEHLEGEQRRTEETRQFAKRINATVGEHDNRLDAADKRVCRYDPGAPCGADESEGNNDG